MRDESLHEVTVKTLRPCSSWLVFSIAKSLHLRSNTSRKTVDGPETSHKSQNG